MDNTKICALVIDNEQKSRSRIRELLQQHSKVTEIITVENTNQAILKIINATPDVIFLGYPSQGNAEKELFELVKTRLPETTLAFVSETKVHAATAIQNGIYNYLLKPVTKKGVFEVIESVMHNKLNNVQKRLTQIIEKPSEDVRLRFPTPKGYVMISPDELIFCRSVGSFTELILTSNRTEMSHMLLLKFEETLSPFNFLRVSRWQLINQKFIRGVNKKTNTIVLSDDGKEYEIKTNKEQIKNLINFDSD